MCFLGVIYFIYIFGIELNILIICCFFFWKFRNFGNFLFYWLYYFVICFICFICGVFCLFVKIVLNLVYFKLVYFVCLNFLLVKIKFIFLEWNYKILNKFKFVVFYYCFYLVKIGEICVCYKVII